MADMVLSFDEEMSEQELNRKNDRGVESTVRAYAELKKIKQYEVSGTIGEYQRDEQLLYYIAQEWAGIFDLTLKPVESLYEWSVTDTMDVLTSIYLELSMRWASNKYDIMSPMDAERSINSLRNLGVTDNHVERPDGTELILTAKGEIFMADGEEFKLMLQPTHAAKQIGKSQPRVSQILKEETPDIPRLTVADRELVSVEDLRKHIDAQKQKTKNKPGPKPRPDSARSLRAAKKAQRQGT